ncbi:MAG: glutathione S-transferase family protein [Alphaproteobacteria bacterium]
MPEPSSITLRYFNCRGRAQALRDVLMDSGLPFDDELVEVGPKWPAQKQDKDFSGPFGSLPLLIWGNDRVAQTLAIASYLSRRLGHYEGRDTQAIARLEMISSAAYLDLITSIGEMRWQVGLAKDEVTWNAWFDGYVQRARLRIPYFEQLLASADSEFFGGNHPVAADFFVYEAMSEWRETLGPSLLDELSCPLLSRFTETISARPHLLAYRSAGRRPAAFSGSPTDADALKRLQAAAKTRSA